MDSSEKLSMLCIVIAGAVDSQGTSQNSLQRAKRKARDTAGVAGRGKRPSRAHEDALMSQMGCSQQVTYHSHYLIILTGLSCAYVRKT